MFRFIGSMWGSFWLFRVMLFVIDPLLRNQEAAAILICIWGSAPLGRPDGSRTRAPSPCRMMSHDSLLAEPIEPSR